MLGVNIDQTALFVGVLVAIFGGVAAAFFAMSRSKKSVGATELIIHHFFVLIFLIFELCVHYFSIAVRVICLGIDSQWIFRLVNRFKLNLIR